MSQAQKKKKADSGAKVVAHEPAVSSPDVQEKLMHLQTILLLTQLNSAYYELGLSLQQVLARLESRYRKNKLNAFLQIYHYTLNSHLVKAKQGEFQTIDKKRQMAKLDDQLWMQLEDEQFSQYKAKKGTSGKHDQEEVRVRLAVECRARLTKMIKSIDIKSKSHLSYAWHRLVNAESITVRIMSEKSSKIETNQSHRSKVFKRSVQRKPNRKSYSLEKSGLPTKHDYFVPVKFQNTKQQTPNPKSQERISEPSQSSALNRFLQDRGDMDLLRDRKSTLTMNSEKNLLKNLSSKKMSLSMLSGEKDDKIRELQYLRGKYRKIMDEFNWFSERFKRVIEEEDEVE